MTYYKMLDTSDPTTITTITLVVSYILFVIILYMAKPAWVKIVDNDGNSSVSFKLVFSYSTTFALVCALTALILSTKNNKTSSLFSHGAY